LRAPPWFCCQCRCILSGSRVCALWGILLTQRPPLPSCRERCAHSHSEGNKKFSSFFDVLSAANFALCVFHTLQLMLFFVCLAPGIIWDDLLHSEMRPFCSQFDEYNIVSDLLDAVFFCKCQRIITLSAQLNFIQNFTKRVLNKYIIIFMAMRRNIYER
jgi:hypothetical protein